MIIEARAKVAADALDPQWLEKWMEQGEESLAVHALMTIDKTGPAIDHALVQLGIEPWPQAAPQRLKETEEQRRYMFMSPVELAKVFIEGTSAKFDHRLGTKRQSSVRGLHTKRQIRWALQDERDGAVNFAELREQRTQRFQQARQREVESIAAISERIADEFEKEALVPTLTTQVSQAENKIAGYNSDLSKLVVKGTEAQAQRHAALNIAAQQLTSRVQAFSTQRRAFAAMQDEVNEYARD